MNFKGVLLFAFSLREGVEFAIFQASHNRYTVPTIFSIVKIVGYDSNILPNPSPTRRAIRGNPMTTPSIWGIVFLYPKVSPEDNNIILLGPGVIDVAKENTKIDMSKVIENISTKYP